MSLRLRLILFMVGLVAGLAIALSALHLNALVNSLSNEAIDRSSFVSQRITSFLLEHIGQHSADFEPAKGMAETKVLWNEIVATDRDLGPVLEQNMALSPSIVEVNIASETGQVLASSNPGKVGGFLTPFERLEQWRDQSLYRQLMDLVRGRRDYQVSVPIGIEGQTAPVFTIQVVTSSVLLRDTLLPQIRRLAEVSLAALVVTLLFTALLSHRLLRPVKRIEQTIDRIVQGQDRIDAAEAGSPEAREFAVVEDKLNLLGQQFKGARQDASALRSNVEELLEKMASQLDVADRLIAIGRLTGGVAHEIKNPLNALSLHIDLLRAKGNEQTAGEMEVLAREVRRLDRVVKTFLDFSRPVEVRFSNTDLNAVVRETAEFLAPQASAAGTALTVETGPEAAVLRGDADMLKQAVLNLAANALEAMGEGGSLILRVGSQGRRIMLDVADTGPGIPPEVSEKIFHLYYTTKPQGSGMGLAMTFRAVQLHNGTISLTSEIGNGTTFHLEFPAI